jgi:NADH-quinone oxidoreductase subunit L
VSVALLTVLGPLAASALILLLRRAEAVLALFGALVAVVASGLTLLGVAGGARPSASYAWLPGLLLRARVDPLAALLGVTVAGVGLLVLVYAVGYMEGERNTGRFYAEMSFFLAAMQALVLAGDWILFLGAWELIGLASYLLIGYWYEREDARAAATRAFLTTRAADVGLYVGVFLLATTAGTTEIAATLGVRGVAAAIASLLLLVAAAGKAAQTPFQGWLADAMAGPTPVSALLHSATLVAAGVILMLRVFPLLPAGVLLAVGTLGGLTTIVAGLTAFAQRDLKRLLAASTSSQLGLMFLGLGAGSPAAAAFHLVAHAAMKSSLFLGAGMFQHARESTEFDRLRGVGREHRAVYAGFAVAGLALAGLPPLAGFWSKDALLAATFASATGWLLGPLAFVGSLLTAMYVGRALRLLWQGAATGVQPRGSRWMGTGLAGLALAAASLGLLAGPLQELLGVRLPEGTLAVVLGLLAAAGGLAAGWGLEIPGARHEARGNRGRSFPNRLAPSAYRLVPGLRPMAEAGFRLDGGFDVLVARPVMRLASGVDRLDVALHSVVLAVGRRALRVAGAVRSADAAAHGWVEGVGALGLKAARFVRLTDEDGIDALIGGLVRNTRELGRSARRLQTGLVHQELALAVGGAAGLILLLALAILKG